MRNFRNLIHLSRKLRNMPYYAVAKGNKVGIYSSWDECKAQVDGYSGAKYKKFKTSSEAENFLKMHGVDAPKKNVSDIEDGRKELAKVAQKIPFVDFWPEDVSDGEEDDYFLAAVAAELDAKVNGKEHKQSQATISNKDSLKEMLKKLGKPSIVYSDFGKKSYEGHDFPIDSDGFVLVYTDGSCENNGRYNAIAGLGVYFEDNHPLNAAKPVSGRATNNAGEIQAACEAIRIAQRCKIDKLRINTDSQFLINSATLWIRGWKRKNWTLSDGKPVKNKEDFSTLDKLISGSSMTIRWNYVKGHAGIKGNERADRLARDGALLYVSGKRRKIT